MRRIYQTHAQAAHTLRHWEEAQRLLIAEEAIDDPMKMIPYLMNHEALRGKVVHVDLNHSVQGSRRRVKRPLITLEVDAPFLMPLQKTLYWTQTPNQAAYCLISATPLSSTKVKIVLQHSTSRKISRPTLNDHVVFSIHTTKKDPPLLLSSDIPWTHLSTP